MTERRSVVKGVFGAGKAGPAGYRVNVVQSPKEAQSLRARRGGDGRSLRQRREVKPAEERRRNILDAALSLFSSKGFADTTVSDIAAEAGMGTGTVYLYFPSKEHVLQGLHDRFRDENAAKVAEAAADAIERAAAGEPVDFRDTVDAILDALAATFSENRDLVIVCTKYRPETIEPALGHEHPVGHLHLVGQALAEGVRLGLIHTSDPEMTGYLFDAAVAYNLHTHFTFGDPPDLDRLIAAAKEMIHKSLEPLQASAPPPGRPAPKPSSKRGSRRTGRLR
jgi:AcrR family transcriptional regulator